MLKKLPDGGPRGSALEELVSNRREALPGVKVIDRNVLSGFGEAEHDIVLPNTGHEGPMRCPSREDRRLGCTMSSRNITSFETMLIGYTDAAARFDGAAKERDPQATFIAAFEALNWAVALDDRVRRQWNPDGRSLGWKWRERLGHGAEIMGGVRFVRNSVHHQWADAFRVDNAGRTYPKTYPVVFFEWVWRPADELPAPDQQPRKEDEDVYRQQMEGRPVRVALDVLSGAFYWLGRLLEPHTIRKNWQAEDLPFPAVEPHQEDPAG